MPRYRYREPALHRPERPKASDNATVGVGPRPRQSRISMPSVAEIAPLNRARSSARQGLPARRRLLSSPEHARSEYVSIYFN